MESRQEASRLVVYRRPAALEGTGRLIGYARVSKTDGSQSPELQREALVAAGVDADGIYEDRAAGAKENRPGLEACLRALPDGDVLVVWSSNG